ncbi:capsular biosynthesis protein [Leptospira yasudae]|uniref:Capsular biosynthesis protein n=1 Tax=Leptospira yasudae TaxID=2202201 RepID=A0A6N4QZL5_9LEPT|nr:capsular biosynthesis protein [Leptospira yasudae]TGL77741.1 capsular biosynthesis protein [Leptospira yasudae]TGL81147.1 capsular biosynthesis protein [Leptospira yasudae]TGL82568.1 capsular biosynthesis protein [Leptospira yasudae]
MKAIIFSPHSYLWPHTLPEAHVVHSLRKNSIDILYVTCGELLNSWCVPMESTGENETMSAERKKEICTWCNFYKGRIDEIFRFPKIELIDFFTPEDKARMDSILNSITSENVLDLEVDGYPIGRASLYNFFLQHKKMTQIFSVEDLPALKLHLSSSLKAFFSGARILEKFKPDSVFFYSSSYSANLVIRLQAEAKGIKCYSLFAGSNWANRLEKMHVARKDSFTHFYDRDKLWRTKFQHLNATEDSLLGAEKFIKIMLSGESVFLYGGKSSSKSPSEIRSQFGIDENAKVVLLASSSYDEVNSANLIGALPPSNKSLFADQKEWIKETIDYFRKLPEVFLVIRVHPRELPNQRDNVLSPHYNSLMEILKDLPNNVKVNLPKDNVSFNDWLEVTDLGLISWSSAGRDLAAWGIPFISYLDQYSFYPRDQLGYVPETKVDYFNGIKQLLTEGWSSHRLIQTYRWLAYEMNDGVFDLSDIVDSKLEYKESILMRIIKRVLRKLNFEKSIWLFVPSMKQSKLVAERIRTGKSVEDVLEKTRKRLKSKEELALIKKILRSVANQKFGENWQSNRISSLRDKIFMFLNE